MIIFVIIGWIWFIGMLIKAAIDDDITRQRVSKTGSGVYRSPNGGLRHTSTGKKLNDQEILKYYMDKVTKQ